ncbi:MAG TPA: hydroxymethylbilane synthase [Xanthobacteraceae bacterium]|nr:hydroxymethylbilane synthase [Xanthobacteraceae bacterium]
MVQSSHPVLRIGTRGSPLALAQTYALRRALAAAHGWDEAAIVVTVIKTSGDLIQDRPLTAVGGKGLFTKEIEQALLDGAIDLAVHSAKDMPTELPPGLDLIGCLPRADARDVFISPKAQTFEGLSAQAVVGTASLRRAAMVKRRRADLSVVSLRGNVETRLKKLEAGTVDATLLALAGLTRLGLEGAATAVLSVDEFLPAVGQGIIVIESRARDAAIHDLVAAVDDADTSTALRAERAFLRELDGSCRTPIAGHATLANGTLRLRGMILKPDGSEVHDTTRSGPRADAARMGAEAGRELRGCVPADFF